MNKEEIMNTYAIEQGYENWEEYKDQFLRDLTQDEIQVEYNKVTDLIQEEFKKKIYDRFNGGFERCRIIETEIL